MAIEDLQGVAPRLREELQSIEGRVAAAQADSVAADVATLVADFNALLAKLRAAGLMEE